MTMRALLFLRIFLAALAVLHTGRALAQETIPAECRQLLVVSTPNWKAKSGTLRRWERPDAQTPWRPVGEQTPVVVGQKGLAWGLGLHPTPPSDQPTKHEGDGKAPAGLFSLPSAFGYAPTGSAAGIQLPYTESLPTTVGVDDPSSIYYNQIVDRTRVPSPDWKSAEKMRRDDERYRWGVVIAHNPKNQPSAGSCIFLHVWRSAERGTAGCTAMTVERLVTMLRWLAPAQNPLLLQLPAHELAKWPDDPRGTEQ